MSELKYIFDIRNDLEVISTRNEAPEDGADVLKGNSFEGLIIDSGATNAESQNIGGDIWIELKNISTDASLIEYLNNFGWTSEIIEDISILDTTVGIDIQNNGEIMSMGRLMKDVFDNSGIIIESTNDNDIADIGIILYSKMELDKEIMECLSDEEKIW